MSNVVLWYWQFLAAFWPLAVLLAAIGITFAIHEEGIPGD